MIFGCVSRLLERQVQGTLKIAASIGNGQKFGLAHLVAIHRQPVPLILAADEFCVMVSCDKLRKEQEVSSRMPLDDKHALQRGTCGLLYHSNIFQISDDYHLTLKHSSLDWDV